MLNINKYEGDDKFVKILKEIECPSDLIYIKALIQGSLAASYLVMPNVLINEIFVGNEIIHNSQEQLSKFYSNFFSLWNQCSRQIYKWRYESPNPKRREFSFSDLITYISDLRREIEGFLRGLELGGTNLSDMSRSCQKSFKSLVGACASLEVFLPALKKENAETIELKKIISLVRKFHKAKNSCIQRVIMGLEKSRQINRKKRMRIPIRELVKKPIRREKVGRNDPCPCGSGKKYKKCCGLKTPTDNNTYH
jgi:hypothetical protein